MAFHAYIVLTALLIAALVCRITTIWGSAQVLQGKSPAMGVATAILAMIPCSPLWLVSMPLGVWILLVLSRREAPGPGQGAGPDPLRGADGE
jgi:hypothetical protein